MCRSSEYSHFRFERTVPAYAWLEPCTQNVDCSSHKPAEILLICLKVHPTFLLLFQLGLLEGCILPIIIALYYSGSIFYMYCYFIFSHLFYVRNGNELSPICQDFTLPLSLHGRVLTHLNSGTLQLVAKLQRCSAS